MKQESRLELTRVAHSANRRCAIFFECDGSYSSRGMQRGCRAKDPAMTFAGILHNIDQERCVSAVAAHKVHAVKASRNEYVNDGNPEILKDAPACIHGSG